MADDWRISEAAARLHRGAVVCDMTRGILGENWLRVRGQVWK